MKIQLVLLFFIGTIHSFFAQVSFDTLENQETITVFSVNKKMFDLMSKVKMDTSNQEVAQYLKLIQKLDQLKVFNTTNTKAAAEIKNTFEHYSLANGLEELMRTKEEGKNLKLMTKSSGSETKIKELLLFIETGGKNSETVLMSITGNFDLNEIYLLTDKLKIPGGSDLKKATKK